MGFLVPSNRFLARLGFVLLWTVPSAPQASAAEIDARPMLAVSGEEQAWLRSHPTIRVGIQVEFPPYYFSDTQGRYEGFVIDLMERLGRRLGLHFEYRRYERIGEMLDAVRAGEIEMTPFLAETASRREYLRFVRPLFSTQTVYVADRRRSDVTDNSNFSGYRVAVERQSPAAELLHGRFPRAHVLEYGSPEKAILAVASGDADVFVGYRQVAIYYMEKNFTANLVLRGAIAAQGTAFGPAVRKDLSVLANLLEKAVNDLSAEEISALAFKWLPRRVLEGRAGLPIQLTDAQKEWIRTHRSVRIGFDANFAPIAFSNAAGGFDGLAADLTRAIADRAGLIIAYERGGTFADVYDEALHGRVDVIVAAARNDERERYFDFVGPFLRVPSVIVAATDRVYNGDLAGANGLRVAILRQHFLIPQLQSRYPELTIVEMPSQADVLRAVREGRADLAIGNMKVVNALIEAEHEGALRTVGTVPEGESELYLAVRKTTGELAPILRRAMDAIPPEEIARFESRWLQLRVDVGVPWRRVLAWGALGLAGALLIIGALLVSNARLRDARAILQRSQSLIEEENAARGRFTAYLSHELRGTLGGLASGLQLVQSGESVGAKLVPVMQESAAHLLALCERTLDFERTLHGGVDLQPEAVRLVQAIRRSLAPWRLQAQLRGLAFDDAVALDPNLWVRMDPVRFDQVLQNIVGNAVKFTSTGGVSVQAHLEPDGESGAWLDVRIRDSGPGIAAEERTRIFEPYAQGAAGQRTRQGAGLGLSIVARIVKAMKGSIEVEDTPPPGATFHVRLPLVAVPAPA